MHFRYFRTGWRRGTLLPLQRPGTGHHLHEVVLLPAFLHALDEAADIGGSEDDRHVDGEIPHLKAGFLDRFQAADRRRGLDHHVPVEYSHLKLPTKMSGLITEGAGA